MEENGWPTVREREGWPANSINGLLTLRQCRRWWRRGEGRSVLAAASSQWRRPWRSGDDAGEGRGAPRRSQRRDAGEGDGGGGEAWSAPEPTKKELAAAQMKTQNYGDWREEKKGEWYQTREEGVGVTMLTAVSREGEDFVGGELKRRRRNGLDGGDWLWWRSGEMDARTGLARVRRCRWR